jgi:hypothetical protein
MTKVVLYELLKTVIDFTAMLPEEVQHFFIQNQNQNICGRMKRN